MAAHACSSSPASSSILPSQARKSSSFSSVRAAAWDSLANSGSERRFKMSIRYVSRASSRHTLSRKISKISRVSVLTGSCGASSAGSCGWEAAASCAIAVFSSAGSKLSYSSCGISVLSASAQALTKAGMPSFVISACNCSAFFRSSCSVSTMPAGALRVPSQISDTYCR